MATRFPQWSQLRPSRARRPLTAIEEREYQAVRLALLLAAGVLQAGSFVAGVEPIPGDAYDHLTWLRRTLKPLVCRSPTIASFVRMINLEGPRIGWDDPKVVRRHLRCLASEVEHLAAGMRGASRGRQASPRP